MSKILIVKGIDKCTNCPKLKMENDGHSTQPVCLMLHDYLDDGYRHAVPNNCPLPDEGTGIDHMKKQLHNINKKPAAPPPPPALERVSYILKAKKMV